MRALPAVRQFNHVDYVGVGGTTAVWTSTAHMLLSSTGHARLRNGAWSGGDAFFQTSINQVHEGAYLHKNYLRSGLSFPGCLINGVSSCPIARPVNPLAVVRPVSTAMTDVGQYYATGYSKARPGRPAADLGQFIYELRDFPAIPLLSHLNLGPKQALERWLRGDGPQAVNPLNGRLVKPSKPGRSLLSGPARRQPGMQNPAFRGLVGLANYRNIGSEYLNVVFGWEPFVRDLQKIYRLWQEIDKRLAQLVRENGKSIRRKATVLEDRTSTQTTTNYNFPWANVYGAVPSFGTGWTHYTHIATTYTRVWFSAAFQYYIPDIGSSRWTQKARRALFGVQPTPELLWNVLPWSWLVDWFSNVGDTISNLHDGAVENLTVRNSFIMKHTVTQDIYHAHVHRNPQNSPGNAWDGVDHPFNSHYTKDEKIRDGGGNPFGLHVQLPSLSGRQLGILAALGISRSRVK